jgi:hypothetical protein
MSLVAVEGSLPRLSVAVTGFHPGPDESVHTLRPHFSAVTGFHPGPVESVHTLRPHFLAVTGFHPGPDESRFHLRVGFQSCPDPSGFRLKSLLHFAVFSLHVTSPPIFSLLIL